MMIRGVWIGLSIALIASGSAVAARERPWCLNPSRLTGPGSRRSCSSG